MFKSYKEWVEENQELFSDEEVFEGDCPKCDGEGYIVEEYDEMEHEGYYEPNEYDEVEIGCNFCDESGVVDVDTRPDMYKRYVFGDIEKLKNSCPTFYAEREEEINRFVSRL